MLINDQAYLCTIPLPTGYLNMKDDEYIPKQCPYCHKTKQRMFEICKSK